jgi:hypothetical protein
MGAVLDKLTVVDFKSRVGETFRAAAPGSTVDLVLAEVTDLAGRFQGDGSRRTPFSLIFRGPVQPFLPQQIYPLDNDVLGRLEIFLVPLGPDGQGMRYEAVFN